MNILIKRCNVIDNCGNAEAVGDILISGGKIINIQKDIANTPIETQVINAEGLYAAPGLIDMHCHLREPGFEYKEDINTGTMSAAAGGFTTVACMPNTNPVIDNPGAVLELSERIKKSALINVLPIAAVTKGQHGEKLTEFSELKDSGAYALSDDGKPVENTAIMKEALLFADKVGLTLISHCEEMSIAGGACNEGEISKKLGLVGIPESAENIMIARDCLLSLEYDVPVHIAHVSTKTGVELIRFFKKKGARITCETCPHYFSLDESYLLKSGTDAKMNPPLRKKEDVLAIIDAIKDDTIDVIATDHAPHAAFEKAMPLNKAPNGIVGLETAFSVGLKYLVKPGHITLERLIYKMSKPPADILKIEKGKLIEGADADIILFNPFAERKIDVNRFYSKSKNSPYNGFSLSGEIKYTLVNGRIIYKNV